VSGGWRVAAWHSVRWLWLGNRVQWLARTCVTHCLSSLDCQAESVNRQCCQARPIGGTALDRGCVVGVGWLSL